MKGKKIEFISWYRTWIILPAPRKLSKLLETPPTSWNELVWIACDWCEI